MQQKINIKEIAKVAKTAKSASIQLAIVKTEIKNTALSEIAEALRKKGVGASVYYHTPIHQMPYYQQFGEYHLPTTERTAQQVFSLPVHPGVTPKDVDYIANSVKQVTKTLSM